MATWKTEEIWLKARKQVLADIQTAESHAWLRIGNRTYRGADKDKFIAKLGDRLARIEAAGEQLWKDRLHA